MPVLFRGDVKICEVEVMDHVPGRVDALGQGGSSVQHAPDRYVLIPRTSEWPAGVDTKSGYRLEFEDGRSVNLKIVKTSRTRRDRRVIDAEQD
jgi:hypothetical protein